MNKYAEAEKTECWGRSEAPESEVEYELLEKLIMICHANPYWLFDEDVEADYAEYDMSGAAADGDAPLVYASPDVILRWIEAGKPQTMMQMEQLQTDPPSDDTVVEGTPADGTVAERTPADGTVADGTSADDTATNGSSADCDRTL